MLNRWDRNRQTIAAERHQALQDSHERLLVALEAVLTHIVLPSDGPNVENCDNTFKQARDVIQQARKVRT